LIPVSLTVFYSGVLSSTAFAAKINSNVSPITLNEGSSQAIQLTLNAPIICPMDAPTCEVDLTFTSPDSTVSFTPTTVTWLSTEWSQNKTLTVNTTNDGIYNNDVTTSITSTAVTSSVYYSGFQLTIPLTIDNINPIPPLPEITDKTVSLVQNTSTSVNVLSGVSGNPDPSTLSIITGPNHGSAYDPSGVITYTPDDGYVGSDSLTYQVCSLYGPSVCNTATLTFNVTSAINSPNTGFGSYQNNAKTNLITALLAILGMSGLLVSLRKIYRD
jgi:hypothetical protein